MLKPGRNGVAMPIGPDKRTTGTTGPRLKGHMRKPLSVVMRSMTECQRDDDGASTSNDHLDEGGAESQSSLVVVCAGGIIWWQSPPAAKA
jgi:hypothetical protein